MGETEISWTHRPGTVGRTWNPGQGCSRVSEGCRNCYAERLAARFAENGWSRGLINLKTRKWNGTVRLAPHKLAEPLSWRKPSTVFANSMTDLFHEGYSNEQIAAVFGVMAACPQHTFQVLTKRAKRMREWFDWAAGRRDDADAWHPAALECSRRAFDHLEWHPGLADERTKPSRVWPLPNVWIGVSVENQAAADERIPELLAAPAAIRFLSCEPLLGPVDLRSIQYAWGVGVLHNMNALSGYGGWTKPRWEHRLHWVIAGCESGPCARACDVEWLRSLRDQCAAAGVPFFLKQAVELRGSDDASGDSHRIAMHAGSKRKPGGLIELPALDGEQWAQFPTEAP